MTVSIKIAKNRYALVDDEDAERVSSVDWHLRRSANTFYAGTSSQRIGKNNRLMHRMILHAPVGTMVDHINGNGLDNRRCNLRLVTPRQNAQNQFLQEREDGKSSRFKGVYWSDGAGLWLASIKLDAGKRFIGSFEDEVEAARAYDAAAVQFFGEYARTNEMMGLYDGQEPVERNRHEVKADAKAQAPAMRAVKREPWEYLVNGRTPKQKRMGRQRARLASAG